MKTISEVYKEYEIMPGLEMHMLRVAAVAKIICDNSQLSVDQDSLLRACLLHDMGNIIKSELSLFPELRGGMSQEYWEGVKKQYINKYGTNEHEASMEILDELGMPEEVKKIVSSVDFNKISGSVNESIEIQIALYCDSRVGPLGIISMKERMSEGKARYQTKQKGIYLDDAAWDRAIEIYEDYEKKFFANSSIKPGDINDALAAPIITELKNFVIK